MGSRPIPQKLYYRIGEVAEIAAVRTHVLRYWETEFGFLSPRKNEGNHRLYTQKDLQKVLTIKKLLYELDDLDFDEGMERGAQVNVEARMTEACREGVAAFLRRSRARG